MDIVKIVSEFGFPIVMVAGLGYFVYFVWQTITNKIDPAVQEMKSHHYKTYRSITPVRSRYDTITAESKYSFRIKGRK